MVCDTLHKSNLVYTVVFPQFLVFQKNNSAKTVKINTDVWALLFGSKIKNCGKTTMLW